MKTYNHWKITEEMKIPDDAKSWSLFKICQYMLAAHLDSDQAALDQLFQIYGEWNRKRTNGDKVEFGNEKEQSM